MQLDNNRVWDYTGDNYVHRLVQNKADGKLVQVDEGGNVVEEEKLDSINLEVGEETRPYQSNGRHIDFINIQGGALRDMLFDKLLHQSRNTISIRLHQLRDLRILLMCYPFAHTNHMEDP